MDFNGVDEIIGMVLKVAAGVILAVGIAIGAVLTAFLSG